MAKADSISNAAVPVATVDSDLVGSDCVQLLQEHLNRLHSLAAHPNRELYFDHLFVTLLIGFYQPCDRSLRLMDDLSQCEDAVDWLPAGRSPRSTMSDAMASFDPKALQPLVEALARRLPGLAHGDNDLAQLLNRMRIADGSVFTVPADVAWALTVSRKNQDVGKQLRFNLQLTAVCALPATFSVSGEGDGSETAAFARDIDPGILYVADRNFIDFKFLRVLLEKNSDFVVRAKTSPEALTFCSIENRSLSEKDRSADVQSDRIGHVPGSQNSPGFGDRLFREVIVHDYRNNKTVRLLTTLLDVPAWVIAALYRRRWDIELFFRWLKCVAKFEHLFSHSRNGVAIQFYVAIIGMLLTYIRTGRRPGKYEFHCLGWVAAGRMSAATMNAVLIRRQRERDQNNVRYRRRRAAELALAKNPK